MTWSPQPETFGVSPHEIVKRDDPETSREAAEGIDIDAQIWTVLQMIRDKGGARSLGGPGVTGDDLAIAFGVVRTPYSSVKGHIVTLERQCYVERPQIKRPGSLHGNNQLVIWALTHEEREERLRSLREGLSRQPDAEFFAMMRDWIPLQEQFDKLEAELEELKSRMIDYFIPERPLGTHKVPLGVWTEDGEQRQFTFQMELRRYSRRFRLKRRRM